MRTLSLLAALLLVGCGLLAAWVLRGEPARADDAVLEPAAPLAAAEAPTGEVALRKPLLPAPLEEPNVAEAASRDEPDGDADDERTEAPARRAVAPDRPLGLVWLYQHATHDGHFPGEAWRVGPGVHEAGVAFADDDLSAIQVPPGVEVIAYDHGGESGPRVRIGPGLHDLEFYGMNDRISSLRVAPLATKAPGEARRRGRRVVLYEHDPESPEGRTWHLPLDPERDTQLFSCADDWFPGQVVSGIDIPAGVEATLFKAKNGLGLALALGAGRHRLDIAGFNDATQSVRVRWLE